MAEEEDTTTEEEETAVEPVPASIEELNEPVITSMGAQATGLEELGDAKYDPKEQVVQEEEKLKTDNVLLDTYTPMTPAQSAAATDVAVPTAPEAALVDVDSVERTYTNLPTSTAAQGEISSGALIDPNQVVDERTKAEMAERGSLAEAQTQDLAQEATVQYQVEKLMASLDSGDELPAWAAPSVRKAKAIMNQRGLGSSSMAAAAMVQALMESGVPIAAADAQAYATLQLQNLNNEQQTALANAATIAAMDRQNLDNRMKAAQQNASTFLQMDLTNLSNRQATETLNYQSKVQSLFTDQAAVNAAKQFNATTQNQVNEFYDQLGATVATNNANREVANNQFNVDQSNAIQKYNAKLEDARDKFNSTMQAQIEQSNTLWQRTINTANNAEQNNANRVNTAAVLGMTTTAMANLWQKYRDDVHYAFTSTENAAQRAQQLALTALQNQFTENMFNLKIDAESEMAIGSYLGSLVQGALTTAAGNLIGSGIEALTGVGGGDAAAAE